MVALSTKVCYNISRVTRTNVRTAPTRESATVNNGERSVVHFLQHTLKGVTASKSFWSPLRPLWRGFYATRRFQTERGDVPWAFRMFWFCWTCWLQWLTIHFKSFGRSPQRIRTKKIDRPTARNSGRSILFDHNEEVNWPFTGQHFLSICIIPHPCQNCNSANSKNVGWHFKLFVVNSCKQSKSMLFLKRQLSRLGYMPVKVLCTMAGKPLTLFLPERKGRCLFGSGQGGER